MSFLYSISLKWKFVPQIPKAGTNLVSMKLCISQISQRLFMIYFLFHFTRLVSDL